MESHDQSSNGSSLASTWPLDRMPQCMIPPNDEFSPVEHYVTVAITARSDPSRAGPLQHKTEKESEISGSDSSYLSGYRSIVDCIRKRHDPPLLWKILLALRARSLSMIASSPQQHAHLLHVIMKLDAYKPPKAFTTDNNSNSTDFKRVLNVMSNEEAIKYFTEFTIADAHLHLLVGLVSANSIFLVPCLESIWKSLMSESNASVSKTSRLHSALATTLRLVPKAHTELFPIISRHIPFRRAEIAKQEWYAKQCLEVLQYQPDLHEEILRLLIEKCLEIDVEIKVEHGGKVSIDEREEDDDNMFDFDMDEEEVKKKEMEKKKLLQEKVEVDEMAERLDVLLTILMNHIQEYSDISIQANLHLVAMSFRIFNSSILNTHRSKYVQFLILYVCGLEEKKAKSFASPETEINEDDRIYRQFAAQLINNLLSAGRTSVERQLSVCYLASFVARSSFISPCTVCESIAALLRWADAYIDSHYDISMDKGRLNVARNGESDQQLWKSKVQTHAVFFNVCQAAFYIMCFRGREAIEYYKKVTESQKNQGQNFDHDELDFISIDIGPHRWTKICRHEQLQPLKYCLESVRREFVLIAKYFHLLPKAFIQNVEEEDEKMTSLIADREARMLSGSAKKIAKRRTISTPVTKEKNRLRDLELKRKGAKKDGGVGGLGKGSNPLDSFFPFDPCLLRTSHGFVAPFYIDWDGGIELEVEDMDSDGDQNDDDSNSVSSGSSSSDSSGSSDSESESHDEPNTLEVPDFEPMSIGSVTSVGSGSRLDLEIKKLKRLRAQSIGSGSW